MKLVLLTKAAASGLYDSADAIRKAIGRGELVRGIHWFQSRPRGRIRVDLDAIVEKLTRSTVEPSVRRIGLARGGYIETEAETRVRGM